MVSDLEPMRKGGKGKAGREGEKKLYRSQKKSFGEPSSLTSKSLAIYGATEYGPIRSVYAKVSSDWMKKSQGIFERKVHKLKGHILTVIKIDCLNCSSFYSSISGCA